MRTRLLLLFGIGLCTVGSLPVLATGEVEAAATAGGALQAGTAVDGEPFVDFIFATPAEYTRRTGNSITQYGESPMLAGLVQQGELPPVGERLPDEPLVLRPIDEIGHYGGTIRALTPSGAGYDEDRRLLIWPPDGSEFHPNMIKGWQQAADDRGITLYLRSGMKWSDGEDFGADDFQFWWQDIQNNEMITPEVPSAFRPGGEPATLTVVDPFEVRFDFAVPVPNAIEFWHQSRPWAPRHYLEQYHIDYNADVEANAKAEGFDSWVLAFQFHGVWSTRHDYKYNVPLAPVVDPFVLEQTGTEAFVWTRNPFYHVIDTAGNQLPYIDKIRQQVVESGDLIPLKAMNGEVDFQRTQLSFGDFPIYKQNEASGGYQTYLFENNGSSFALGFALNYTHQDPILREIFNDIRFRQALSLAIDRDDIGETLFHGQTKPFTAPVRPEWPGYEDWMGSYFAEHDVDRANALLDEMGLEWDADRQWRLRSDGKAVQILGEHPITWIAYVEPLLDLVRGYWAQIGVRFEPRLIAVPLWQTRGAANELDVGIWPSDGGTVTRARGNTPIRLIPPYHNYPNSMMSSGPWREWIESGGANGEQPPADVLRTYEVMLEWMVAPRGSAAYEELANEMIRLNVENLRFFGTVSSPPIVRIVNDRIGNMRGEPGWVYGLRRDRDYLNETWYIKR